jgi:acid phosphatase family membrane protein YuiD
MEHFWSNDVLWVPVTAALGVQLYKFLYEWVLRRDFDLRVLTRAGGMPSSHSAMVTSLASAIGYRQGLYSDVFALSVVFAFIVMYDATGVRQAAGKQAKVLNQILRELFSGQPVSEEELKELIGHTPFEVFVGAAVGILYTMIWFEVAARF